MEQELNVSVSGQEIEVDDINLVSRNGALAVDRALAECFRLGSLDRGIIPGGASHGVGLSPKPGGIMRPSGSADASIALNHFRAVIGAVLVGGSDPLEAWQGIRSVVYVPSANIQFAVQASGANSRFDLLYARVDVEQPDTPITRYVKDATDAVSAVSLAVTKSTRVSVAVVQGIAAAVPVYPALPSDSGSSYYLVIGYVYIPAGQTLTTSILPGNIIEAFRALPLAASTGAPNIRPAAINQLFRPTGDGVLHRQAAYLSPSMVGGTTVVCPLHLLSGDPDSTFLPSSFGNIVDDSIDWRNRYFKITIALNTAHSGTGLASTSGGTGLAPALPYGSADIRPMTFMGQSFRGTGGTVASLVVLDNSTNDQIPAGCDLILYVDLTTGKLCLTIQGTVNVELLAWIEATGYCLNAN
jgi:hypothetical protein